MNSEAYNDRKKTKSLASRKVRTIHHPIHHQVYEIHDSFQLEIDLPGVMSSDIVASIENDGCILVQAERIHESLKIVKKHEQKIVLDKRKSNVKESSAKLENGVLYISVPKKKLIDPVIVNITTTSFNDMGIEHEAKSYRELLSLDLPGVVIGDLKVQLHEGNIIVNAKRVTTGRLKLVQNISKNFLYDEDKVNDLSKVRGHLMNGVLTLLLIVESVDHDKKDIETAAALKTLKIEVMDGSSSHHEATVESSSSSSSSSNEDSTFTMIDSTDREANKEA